MEKPKTLIKNLYKSFKNLVRFAKKFSFSPKYADYKVL